MSKIFTFLGSKLPQRCSPGIYGRRPDFGTGPRLALPAVARPAVGVPDSV
jgi:hypothetical protein